MKYRIITKNDKQALFDSNNRQISKWWDNIEAPGLIDNTSEYYIAFNGMEYAIFHKDNPEVPITGWWNYIYTAGLIDGRSEYYVVQNDDYREAIFHIDNPDKPITGWYDGFVIAGVITGESKYYVAYQEILDSYAIFHIDNPNEPISNWWNYIYGTCLLAGTCDYYVAEKITDNHIEYRLFHKDNKDIALAVAIDSVIIVNQKIADALDFKFWYICHNNMQYCLMHKIGGVVMRSNSLEDILERYKKEFAAK